MTASEMAKRRNQLERERLGEEGYRKKMQEISKIAAKARAEKKRLRDLQK